MVCKKTFIDIHAITPAKIRRLAELLVEGKQPNDKKGNAIPENIIEQIENNIRSFPTNISHYSSTQKHYLNEKINMKIIKQNICAPK